MHLVPFLGSFFGPEREFNTPITPMSHTVSGWGLFGGGGGCIIGLGLFSGVWVFGVGGGSGTATAVAVLLASACSWVGGWWVLVVVGGGGGGCILGLGLILTISHVMRAAPCTTCGAVTPNTGQATL